MQEIKQNDLMQQQVKQQMRLIIRSSKYFSINRKLNFFELNPIYPESGQSDFDIYNVQRKRVPVFDKFKLIAARERNLKLLIRENFLRRKYKMKQLKDLTTKSKKDEFSGLPIGLNSAYDAFILQLREKNIKKKKKKYQFKTLISSLINRFKAKSQLELVKLFRISLAHSKKDSFKEKIRGQIIQEAVTIAAKTQGDFFHNEEPKSSSGTVDQKAVDQACFKQALKQIDQKIEKIQLELRARKQGKFNLEWDPVYGSRINEEIENNDNFDMNLKRGFRASKSSNEQVDVRNQNQHIRRRINKLFFLRKLDYLKNETVFNFDSKQLPTSIRDKENIINELAHKYKEEEFLIIPDLNEIYNEIDLKLDKINLRLTPQDDSNSKFRKDPKKEDLVDQKQASEDELIWDKLDVERVFASDYYSQKNLKQQKISERQLLLVTPSSSTELSLNRVPFNLYRHSQCQIFDIFTKYKHMIMKDYINDVSIDPKGEFKYFSLQKASNILKRIKKPQQIKQQKYHAVAKRKTTQAEVFLKHGTGKVTINKQSISDYFADVYHRVEALKPLIFSETAGNWDLQFNVVGGGVHGQSECCAYALAKALMKINPKYKQIFACFALHLCDPRKKQPKRMGLYSARVHPPYVRR